MLKKQKLVITELLNMMSQAHREIEKIVKTGVCAQAVAMLEDCQAAAIEMGTSIEESEGEGTEAVRLLEEYCEIIFDIHEGLGRDGGLLKRNNKLINHYLKKIDKLDKALGDISGGVDSIFVLKEIVFFPYKASMWDSLESIWMAADADPDFNAVVVPIPYFEKNPDGSVATAHYEVNEYPDYVPVVNYDTYDFKSIRPDVIYIHNPYDEYNYVTTIHPFFYSKILKQYTDMLIYVPYFASAGGMLEEQSLCSAYLHADYIVVQAEKFIDYYDSCIPREKFLVMGSPKFDRVIRLCNNPPKPPLEWNEYLEGKKVYFYNTSIGGMLGNTKAFLQKMEYVFDTFAGRDDACLLWRPHPLLESTFESLRKEYIQEYNRLKRRFIDEKIGIYDTTPDIEETIAHCDEYIGDSGSSVISLFGVVGKPVFILNNYINSKPESDDRRGEYISPAFNMYRDNRFMISRHNTLWYAPNNDYQYELYMNLCPEYGQGEYFLGAFEKDGIIYVMPRNAQYLLLIKDKEIVEKIEFDNPISIPGAFCGYFYDEEKIYILPFRYESLVVYDFAQKSVTYVDGIKEHFVKEINGEWKVGGTLWLDGKIVFASPEDNTFMILDTNTYSAYSLKCPAPGAKGGTMAIVPDGDELWLMPYHGMAVVRWNPATGEYREYSDWPDEFVCYKFPEDTIVEERPFGWAVPVYSVDNVSGAHENAETADVIVSRKLVLSPAAGNHFVEINVDDGTSSIIDLGFETQIRGRNGYYVSAGMGGFVFDTKAKETGEYLFWYVPERKLFSVSVDELAKTDTCSDYSKLNLTDSEIQINMPFEQICESTAGFKTDSEWMGYSCVEDSINSLEALLDNSIQGASFDKEKQLQAYMNINISPDGDCGNKLHKYTMKK